MKSILTDNRGEFSVDEIREVSSVLNIEVYTTAAYSPFQNGLCERNHAVTDNMLIKLVDQYPGTSLIILLTWQIWRVIRYKCGMAMVVIR